MDAPVTTVCVNPSAVVALVAGASASPPVAPITSTSLPLLVALASRKLSACSMSFQPS